MPNFLPLILVLVSLASSVWAQEAGRPIYICPDPPDSHFVATQDLPPVHRCKPFKGGKDFYVCPGPAPGYPKYTSNMWEAHKWGCERVSSQTAPLKGIDWEEYARSAPSQSNENGSLADIAWNAAQRGLGLALIMTIIIAVPAAVFFARRLWSNRPSTVGNAAYEAAAAELDSDAKDKGLWARHYAASKGDEQKARAAYIRDRARMIHQESVS